MVLVEVLLVVVVLAVVVLDKELIMELELQEQPILAEVLVEVLLMVAQELLSLDT